MDNANSSVPSQLAGLTGVVAIASGGENQPGAEERRNGLGLGHQLIRRARNGSNANSNVPVQVTGLTGAVAIAGGFYHSLAAVGGSVPALTVNPPSLSFTADTIRPSRSATKAPDPCDQALRCSA